MSVGPTLDRSKYRILLMSSGAGIGGEEMSTCILGESLLERGWDVRVAAMGAAHREELQRRGVPVEALPFSKKRIVRLLRGVRPLARYVARERIDILHAQSADPAVMSLVAKWLGWLPRPRPLLVWHDRGIAHYRVLCRLFNHLDLSIANSDFERAKLISHGLKPAKVVRIHNAIDLGRFAFTAEQRAECRRAIRREFGLDEQVPVVGFVGRLSPEKAPDDFVASFRYARERSPDVRYLIVGDGVMRPRLEGMIRGLHAEDRIILAGFRRDIPELLCAIDVLALVSHMETFGLAALEAMAMRTPCVATAVGGCPEVVQDGVTGLLVADGSPHAIAEALVDILSEPARREAFGQAGHQRAHACFHVDRMVDEVESVYFDLIERRERQGTRATRGGAMRAPE